MSESSNPPTRVVRSGSNRCNRHVLPVATLKGADKSVDKEWTKKTSFWKAETNKQTKQKSQSHHGKKIKHCKQHVRRALLAIQPEVHQRVSETETIPLWRLQRLCHILGRNTFQRAKNSKWQRLSISHSTWDPNKLGSSTSWTSNVRLCRIRQSGSVG